MPFNGTGAFTRNFSWTADKAAGIPITASRFDADENDIASGLSLCITRDGQGVPTSAISWNGQRLTNLADPVAAQDAATLHVLTTTYLPLKGDTSGGTAPAGNVGEIISSNIISPVTLTTNTAANVTSISLTAGDWDVTGEVWYSIGAGGATQIQSGVNSVSATIPTAPAIATSQAMLNATLGAAAAAVQGLRTARVAVAAPTTYYLIALAIFPSGTTTVTGNISARRMR